MKIARTLCALLLLAAIGGCNESSTPTASPSQAAATTPAPAVAPAAKSSHRLAEARLKQIAATGKTGLFADPPNLCGRAGKARVSIAVAWNVPSAARERLTLFRIGKDGKEHQIARGGSLGGRTIGASTQAPNVYVLRDQLGKEIGRLQVDGKQC